MGTMDMSLTAGPEQALPPREREEGAWLPQQQAPSERLSRGITFRLAGALDAERLVAALRPDR
ncbi:hypothetical protein EQG41_07350 [Billgrantia azerbaijanica]|nr:hypothetical protein EQG41_07350 [Halomonas azerbaijanica]